MLREKGFMGGKLTEDDAHDEANMMRAKVSKWRRRKEKTYDSDYDLAFKAIQELKLAAADESAFQKVVAKVLRGAARPLQEFFHATDIAVTGPEIDGDVEEWHRKRLALLEDAEKKLRNMQKAGDEFAREETKGLDS